MAGCSLSLARVDDHMLSLLDAPAETTAWPAAHVGRVAAHDPAPAARLDVAAVRQVAVDEDSPLWRSVVAVCAALIEADEKLTELDQLVGDGDLGISLARGAQAVLKDRTLYDGTDDAAVLRGIAGTVRRTVGGTSGPLYAALVLRTATTLAGGHPWPEAFAEGVEALSELGGAQLGDRTMLDALIPAAVALRTGVLAEAVAAARQGTDETADIVARRGRSSYLGDRALGVVDPGAEAVTIWLDAIRVALANDRQNAVLRS